MERKTSSGDTNLLVFFNKIFAKIISKSILYICILVIYNYTWRLSMINKTSSIEFKKYGSTYEEHMSVKDNNLICRKLNTSGRIISHMYCFSCPVYIELTEGIASILIGNSLEPDKLETFAIHHYLKIDANKYFNIIPLSQEIESYLITPANYNLRTEFLNPPYVYKPIVSKLQIEEILGYYYVIKSPNYRFKGEAHKHYELTYVDHGSLDTTVEGTTYTLNSYDLMLYGPNQFHTQQITKNKSCSYLTVIFNMDIIDDDAILNRIFHCDNELHNIFNKFVKASSNSLPYSKTLMLCYLQEIIILLTQYDSSGETKHISTGPMQHFQDGLLQEILDYMNSMITEPLTIEEICHKFSISRSSLQTLFRNNLEISPKNYMVQIKLKKSKELIRENKYTISEIAFMLGFSSIHYFSRTFKQHFNLTPSEYAKKLYK